MLDAIVKATPIFEKRAKKLITKEALAELVGYLELRPEQGKIIKGCSGVRKLRWRSGRNAKGKSGGVRVLYHYSSDVLLVLLVSLYSKADKEDITDTERNELRTLIPALVTKYKGDL